MKHSWREWSTLALALLILNISLSFGNYWPTPLITWKGELSIELVAVVLVAIGLRGRLRPGSRVALAALAGVWLVLVLGRYFEVTANALYGRPFNAYWDVQYLPDVAAMLLRAAHTWLIVLAGVAVALVLFGYIVGLRWALTRIVSGVADRLERQVLLALAGAAATLFVVQLLCPAVASTPSFPTPATATYARQARLIAEALSGGATIPDGEPLTYDLSQFQGADVVLIFVESYGAVSWERADMIERLKDSRDDFGA